ncbi:MAG: carbamoyltransferase HypF [Bacteroidetes bacterium]|nr:carbamoyltransferase HypF [Bacteroidota bacterium]
MHTYHIHISGLVQGVGFRPFVYKLAKDAGINGWVNNTTDGVHVEFTSTKEAAISFYKKILATAPVNAVITHHHMEEVSLKEFSSFNIAVSNSSNKPDLLLTPDTAICEDCKNELLDENNRRFQYPFITCLNCGPRYSITTQLPYDRENTTMADLQMCTECNAEYSDPYNRRHFSQTNSCKDCEIVMHWYNAKKECLSSDAAEILNEVIEKLAEGKILAIKGVGGYLLVCDAANENALFTLRERKHRPAKPFALLYKNVSEIRKDAIVSWQEEKALLGKAAPIVLCGLKKQSPNGICTELIAPGLDKIGVMLPYTGLLLLIAEKYTKPLVATSGNISGSPILYTDNDALNHLTGLADYVLTYDREIVMPQDDSVMQFTNAGQRIILRRSRGLAPNYFPSPFTLSNKTVLATGGELKSAFALIDNDKLYISQFLGDQAGLESQSAYQKTLQHLQNPLQVSPAEIIVDKHPGYAVTELGKEMAEKNNLPLLQVQHHKAHFAAVLAENNLLHSEEPVLGFIWDGTGYGDDEQIWGGEIFLFENGEIEREYHLDYFPQLLADKMSKEPRLSALSLLRNLSVKQKEIEKNFSAAEWNYYQQLIKQPQPVLTSSMGRLLDGIAALLAICQYNSYEGEAAMKLEVAARNNTESTADYYSLPVNKNVLNWEPVVLEILDDKENEAAIAVIAEKVFNTLARTVKKISDITGISKLAFSGGVFQNALLVDKIIDCCGEEKQLFFHQQLSPNDESIGFGQLAYREMVMNREQKVQECDTCLPAGRQQS